jgi:hypothetical protein
MYCAAIYKNMEFVVFVICTLMCELALDIEEGRRTIL